MYVLMEWNMTRQEGGFSLIIGRVCPRISFVVSRVIFFWIYSFHLSPLSLVLSFPPLPLEVPFFRFALSSQSVYSPFRKIPYCHHFERAKYHRAP